MHKLQPARPHHIAVICSDNERSKRFYTEILGLGIEREVYRAERQSYTLDLSLGGTYLIDLFSFPDPPPRPTRPEAMGLRYLAFGVGDLDEWVDYLAARQVETEPVRVGGQRGNLVVYYPMRALIKSTLWIVGILLVYFLYTLHSTGYFRTIVPGFDGRTLQTVALKGAEDIAISRPDSFAIVSATDRRGYPDPPKEPGGLYLIDLRTGDFTPLPLTAAFDQPFAPHGISVFRQDSSQQVMAINHAGGRHTIEVFELRGRALGHVRTLTHPSLISPNDLVIVGEDRFYFTNDHGYTKGAVKMIEDFAGLPLSTVVYHDSAGYREVATGIAYANGIASDHRRGLLYVASLRHFLVKVYAIRPDGSLSFVEDIPCGTGVDNIELDEEGHLWIGAHPNLLGFTAYARGKKAIAPSEIIKVEYRGSGDYTVHREYLGDGSEMSGSSVAVPWGRLILAGNVMDDKFLVLERNAGPATR